MNELEGTFESINPKHIDSTYEDIDIIKPEDTDSTYEDIDSINPKDTDSTYEDIDSINPKDTDSTYGDIDSINPKSTDSTYGDIDSINPKSTDSTYGDIDSINPKSTDSTYEYIDKPRDISAIKLSESVTNTEEPPTRQLNIEEEPGRQASNSRCLVLCKSISCWKKSVISISTLLPLLVFMCYKLVLIDVKNIKRMSVTTPGVYVTSPSVDSDMVDMELHDLSSFEPASLSGLVTATYSIIKSLNISRVKRMLVVKNNIWAYARNRIFIMDLKLNVNRHISTEAYGMQYIQDMAVDELGNIIIASLGSSREKRDGNGIYGIHKDGSYMGKILHGNFLSVSYKNRILYALKYIGPDKPVIMVKENGKWSKWKMSPVLRFNPNRIAQLIVNNRGMYISQGKMLHFINLTTGKIVSAHKILWGAVLADVDEEGNLLFFNKYNLYMTNNTFEKHLMKSDYYIRACIVSNRAKYLWIAMEKYIKKYHDKNF